MTEEVTIPKGVYKRAKSPYWWIQIGRKIRRSSRSTDLNEAIALRAKAAEVYRYRLIGEDWISHVGLQAGDSNSWLRRAHSHMKRKTRLRGWGECLSFEELRRIMLASEGRCAITGVPFVRSTKPRDPFSVSVDRIDSAKGYCTGNVRLVLLAVNIGMSHWGEGAFRSIARALVATELQSQALKDVAYLVPRETP